MIDPSRVLTIKVPPDTPSGASVFIAGDFNGWSPSHPMARTTMQENGVARFVFPPDVEKAEFKITRGSWDTVECSEQGEQLGNRSWMTTAHNGDLTIEVGGWCDLHPNTHHWRPVHTVVGDLRVLKDVFSPQLGNMRDVLVWLPPGHDVRKDERLPVLYMHDGQNLFDNVTAYDKEWGVDEISTELAETENLRHIVVGINNMGLSRLHEYSPWEDDFRKSRGYGERYVRFILQTIKPMIDAQFRTKPDREHTAIMGSSLGGLISLYAGLTRADSFSFAACMSPSMNVAGGRILRSATSFSGDVRFWIDYGAREFGGNRELSNQMIEAVHECARTLRSNGVDARSYVDPEGEHNETSWRRRLPDIIRWWHEKMPK